MTIRHSMILAAGLASALMLAGCGGGSTPAPLPHEVPASALVSAQAFTNWVGARPASEVNEPLILIELVPPVSDDDEPAPVS